VENRRKTVRISIDEIPEFLQQPILLFNHEEVKSRIENLSPLGIGLELEKEAIIQKGDIFFIKYHCFNTDIKCVCVFSEVDEKFRHIGAYFTDPENQNLILTHLYY
jgi:hypothetical protein